MKAIGIVGPTPSAAGAHPGLRVRLLTDPPGSNGFVLEGYAKVGDKILIEFNPDDQFAARVVTCAERLKDARDAIATMYAAANKLESAWGDLSSADCDLLNEGYPFVGSFDEVCNDLSAWRRGLDEKIAKLTAQESES